MMEMAGVGWKQMVEIRQVWRGAEEVNVDLPWT